MDLLEELCRSKIWHFLCYSGDEFKNTIMTKQGINISKYSILIAFLFSFFLFSSCEKQEEDIENRDAIVGQWDVVENKVDAANASIEIRDLNAAYIVNITRSDVFADEVKLNNFFNIAYNFFVPGVVDGLKITIHKIELRDYVISGTGTIANNHRTIEWSYWVEDPYGEKNEYRATYTFRE